MVHKVLIFGASGLLMPHVIPHIVDKFGLQVTAFVRPGSKGQPALRKLGIDIIEGSWTDEELIKRTIEGFDIVWDVGDSADPALPKLLVPLIEQSVAKPTLIRFTGTGNWITQTGGVASASAKEYDDSSADDIALLHDQMFNGAGDLITLDALNKGINVWILCAGGVYGVPATDVTSTGVFVRLYTNNALGLGYAPYIGEGSSHMQLVHIDDVVSATDLFLEQVLPTVGKPVDAGVSPHTRYFNAPGYSYTWEHIAETWSKVLSGNTDKDHKAKSVTMGEAGFIAPLINAEMKAKAGKLAQLGWQPKGPSIEDTLPSILTRGISLPLA